ncbi:HD domain-containing protein [Sutcliffiella horikoshii]|uniref:HD domain-containing protein n=1 Tax=Sutcliffiella horikoshii TaxID=79883 RepID=A0A5D4SVN4_9BACI|nr:HD domain-containing phosphohydrolase [Sutcliffiella horikoshii]TYS67497.1 HD domain-containing protein [Sutcliffiella horikoshii]
MAFKIGKKGTSLEKVTFDNYDMSLLAKGNGAEVILQTIERGNIFYVYPSENEGVMEFFYILEGEILCEVDGQKINLGPKDYFTATDIEVPIHFTALSEVTYIWVITEAIFHELSTSVKALKEVVHKVESRDVYTFDHSKRVAKYSVKIAKKLKLSTDRLENLFVASILHDIGKINIPSEVLNKPAKLTEQEFSLIKKHPEDGAEMVKDLYYGETIATIIEQHHERLNGRGYPKGLQGEEIVLEARIIAVSDTFDAMTEDRAYRGAFTPEYAVDELQRLSPSQYDSEVVNALIEVLQEEGKLKETSPKA